MLDIKLYLDAIDPRLWWVGITLVVYLVVQLWRWLSQWLPAGIRFEAVPTRARAVPAVLLAAAIGATGLDSTEIAKVLLDLALSSVAGVTAVGGRDILTRMLGAPGAAAASAPPTKE
jgi:hypothetical protein